MKFSSKEAAARVEKLLRSAIVVVGNEEGIIGWGLGKAGEVTAAIAKGVESMSARL